MYLSISDDYWSSIIFHNLRERTQWLQKKNSLLAIIGIEFANNRQLKTALECTQNGLHVSIDKSLNVT